MSVERNEYRRHIPRTVRVEACLPRKALQPPSGSDWLHEIKHDGFRILAQKDGSSVRLITRNGYDFADRYPLIVDAMSRLPVESCIIDGEAIVADQSGLSVFDLLRYRRHDHAATLCAFDLLELNGADLRRRPIEERKGLAVQTLRTRDHGIAVSATMLNDRLNFHYLRLNESVTHGVPQVETLLAGRTAYWSSVAGNTLDAAQTGLAQLHALVLREALVMTFSDTFFVLSLCFVVAIASVALSRPITTAAPPPDAH